MLKPLAAGLATGRIAQRLALSDKTVRNHVSAAVARAQEAGLGR